MAYPSEYERSPTPWLSLKFYCGCGRILVVRARLWPRSHGQKLRWTDGVLEIETPRLNTLNILLICIHIHFHLIINLLTKILIILYFYLLFERDVYTHI